MANAGVYTLNIADRGWTDKREVRAASISASWIVSQIGRFSAVISARDAWRLGIDEFLNLQVRWDDPLLGVWGGIVEDVVANDSGTLELSGEAFTGSMRGRRTHKRRKTVSAPAGSLVLDAFAHLPSNDLPFDDIQVDSSGDPMSMTFKADDLYSVVQRAANGSNMQFHTYVDPDTWRVAFAFRLNLGEDKSGDILLREGRQIADLMIAKSRANIVNDILAVDADADWDEAISVATIDGSSAQTYGLKQQTRRYYSFRSRAALRTRARADLAIASTPVIPITWSMSSRSPWLAEIREGDTVRIDSWSFNAQLLADIVSRSVNVDLGVVTLAANARLAA